MPTLRVVEGPDKGQSYNLSDGTSVIGRSSDQIPLTDGNASRTHAQFQPVNDRWILTDLNSSNGTFLNGCRLGVPTTLRPGDQIRIGCTVLVFSEPEPVEQRIKAAPTRIAHELPDDGSLDGSAILASVDASCDTAELIVSNIPDAAAAWKLVYSMAEIFGSVDSEAVLWDRVAEITFEHLMADRLVLLTREPGSSKLTPRAVRRRHSEGTGESIPAVSRTVVHHVLQSVDGVLCINAVTDDRFGGGSPQDSMVRLGQRSVLCVPIASHGEVFGVLHLDCSAQRHTYTSEQLRLAVAIGRLTGMAIENAVLLKSRVQTERLAAMGETAAYLSHHIRNILQGLQTGTEAMELSLTSENLSATRSGWRLVRRNLDRILQLATNLLTFSKNRSPRAEVTQLNAIVEDVIATSQWRAAEKNVTLVAELKDTPPVTLDPEGMHQALHNIVLNAIDAAPARTGCISVTTRVEDADKRIVVSVSDNGPGVPESNQNQIFAPFHSQKGQSGTGLGLAAANKILRELGGRIRLETGEDCGATFHIEIPCQSAQSACSG